MTLDYQSDGCCAMQSDANATLKSAAREARATLYVVMDRLEMNDLTAIIHEAPVLARGAMFEGPLLLDAHR
jgi:hypothetical protein